MHGQPTFLGEQRAVSASRTNVLIVCNQTVRDAYLAPADLERLSRFATWEWLPAQGTRLDGANDDAASVAALVAAVGNSSAMAPPPFAIPALHQVGVVVRDLEATMRHYWEDFAIGPWHVYTYGPPLVKDKTYHGRRQDYRMRIALCWVGPLMIELIQPLEGPSIYEEFLRDHGEGLHHILTYVEDFDTAVRELEGRGYALLQSGRGYGVHGDGGYAYFDTTHVLGIILEISQVPKERVPPEVIYPTVQGA